MKRLFFLLIPLFVLTLFAESAFAGYKYVDGYYTKSGQYRSGHWRDTSNDGNLYNNANYLGMND